MMALKNMNQNNPKIYVDYNWVRGFKIKNILLTILKIRKEKIIS